MKTVHISLNYSSHSQSTSGLTAKLMFTSFTLLSDKLDCTILSIFCIKKYCKFFNTTKDKSKSTFTFQSDASKSVSDWLPKFPGSYIFQLNYNQFIHFEITPRYLNFDQLYQYFSGSKFIIRTYFHHYLFRQLRSALV